VGSTFRSGAIEKIPFLVIERVLMNDLEEVNYHAMEELIRITGWMQ
jgi:hypothetical protein